MAAHHPGPSDYTLYRSWPFRPFGVRRYQGARRS